MEIGVQYWDWTAYKEETKKKKKRVKVKLQRESGERRMNELERIGDLIEAFRNN